MNTYKKRRQNIIVANVFWRYSLRRLHTALAERRTKAMSTTISTAVAATQNGNSISIRRHRVPNKDH